MKTSRNHPSLMKVKHLSDLSCIHSNKTYCLRSKRPVVRVHSGAPFIRGFERAEEIDLLPSRISRPLSGCIKDAGLCSR